MTNEEKITISDPRFAKEIFRSLVQKNNHKNKNIFQDENFEISDLLDMTAIQESCSVRNVLKARKLGQLLVSDQGDLLLDLLPEMIQELQGHLFSLGPQRHHDILRDEHILDVLDKLGHDKELQRLIKHMSRPLSNKLAEDVVRDTLCLGAAVAVTDVHVKRACLAAWFTYLRQSLGSCFATAPAIIVQQEQPALFLKDLDEMMSTGRLKKTFGGVEYAVPMSISWGNGDLKKPVLLQDPLEANENTIWGSYGIIQAFEALTLIDKELSIAQKVKKSQALLQECFSKISKGRSLFFSNAEELMTQVLLSHYKISQDDIEAFRARPQNMVHRGLLIHVPQTSKKTHGKIDPCVAFLRDIEVAKSAFKSIADNALLKCWEFTIASFSEIKLDFAKWNLYSSLGVNFDDKGGIGECLYQFMSTKVEHANTTLRSLTEEYEQALIQIRYLDARVKSASTEREIEWIKVEYQSKQAELYHIEQQKDIAYEKANKIAHLHEFLIGEYDKRFRDYFQEVYDAEIHDFASGPFDDSPAGFRLIFKHGRSNPSLWTYIRTPAEFVEALVSFFTITEQELREMPQIKGIDQDFSVVITQLVNHVRSDQFLESSLFRMARAHGVPCPAKPLKHLDQVEKKPWVYTSGGSMSTLVSAYFGREERPFEVTRWVESETELFAWFIDTLRLQPEPIMRQYIENPKKSMLIHSPTHAFSLKPGASPFRDSWTSDMYSYSWIKNNVTELAKNFYSKIFVDGKMIEKIVRMIGEMLPKNYRPRLKQLAGMFTHHQLLQDFHNSMSHTLLHDKGLRTAHGSLVSQDFIDSLLYTEFPFIERQKMLPLATEIGMLVLQEDPKQQERFRQLVDDRWQIPPDEAYISSRECIQLINGFLLHAIERTKYPQDLFNRLLDEMRKREMLPPRPVIFADTNWVKDFFAFVVNPGTLQLEFWSVDAYGLNAKPVSNWKMWLNGSRKEPVWGVYVKPYEYVAR